MKKEYVMMLCAEARRPCQAARSSFSSSLVSRELLTEKIAPSCRRFTTLQIRNKLGALLITALLLPALLTTSIVPKVSARALQQGNDVPSEAEQSLFTKGQTFFNQGRYPQAINVFKDLLKNYPKSIIKDLTLLWLGRSYIQEGQ